MSRLMCQCGAGLNNSSVPSENVLVVVAKSDVDNALINNSSISLYDFETGIISDYEYWYCPSCRRVTVVESIPNGKVVCCYNNSPSALMKYSSSLIAFYVFSDVDIYNAEEENSEIFLADFIEQSGERHLYYADQDKGKVYKASSIGYELVYTRE